MAAEARNSQSLRRKLLSILRWPALILIALLLCGWIALGPLARGFLERSLRQSLDTAVAVEDIELRLFFGHSRLERITVQNPPGFDGPPVLVLEKLRCSLPLVAMANPEISIASLEIDRIEIALEMKEAGVNLFLLLQPLRERLSALRAARAEASPASPRRRFRIEKVALGRILVNVEGSLTTAGQKVSIPLPGSELEVAPNLYTIDEFAEALLSSLVRALFNNSTYLELNEKASASFSKSLEPMPASPGGAAPTDSDADTDADES